MFFREVIRPPIWLLLFIFFLELSLVLAIWAAFDGRVTLVAFVLAIICLYPISRALKSTITFDGNVLKIDKAHIHKNFLGDIQVLDIDQFRNIRTRDADPAAFLAIRFWLTQGVKIAVKDMRDPTPYWLISTQKGVELKRALEN